MAEFIVYVCFPFVTGHMKVWNILLSSLCSELPKVDTQHTEQETLLNFTLTPSSVTPPVLWKMNSKQSNHFLSWKILTGVCKSSLWRKNVFVIVTTTLNAGVKARYKIKLKTLRKGKQICNFLHQIKDFRRKFRKITILIKYLSVMDI